MTTIKQPRASIACSRNRDPDYLLLASEGIEGMAAVGLFDALLCAAKDQNNSGEFDVPVQVMAALVGLEIKTYSKLIQKLIKMGWVVSSGSSGSGVTIRSYTKWNPSDTRGGKRPGAGRPSRIGNQNEIKTKSIDNQNGSAPSPSPFQEKQKQPRKRGLQSSDLQIPSDLDHHASAIRKWVDYRFKRKPPIYDYSIDAAYDEWRKFGDRLPLAVDKAIANGWQGLHAVKDLHDAEQEQRPWGV